MKAGGIRMAWLAAAMCLAAPVTAHHSQAMYDASKLVTLSGVVTKFSMVNPHTLIYFEATVDGKKESWKLETDSAVSMMRKGWKRDQFREGDMITVSFHPMRNGEPDGFLREITGPDGVTVRIGGGTGGPPPRAQ